MLRKELDAAVETPAAASSGDGSATAAKAAAKAAESKAAAALAAASDEVIYKIDIPANRYDMLCLEGIARALNVFKGREPPPVFRALPPPASQPRTRIVVKPETALIRPFIVGAVLRGVRFDPARYNSFIDLQDKLHQNLCRQRSLVAIGTHDLAKVKGPEFTYEALPPEAVSFVPLKQTREFRADELLAYYQANDLKLRRYVPLLQGSVVVPVVLDSERAVLSLPPIINGAQSAISLDTRDVLIECTATDLTKAKVVLNTVVSMFSQHCEAEPFSYEQVEVVDAFGAAHLYPDMSARELDVPLEYVNSYLGLSLGAEEVCGLLRSMQLDARVAPEGSASAAVAAGGGAAGAAAGAGGAGAAATSGSSCPALAIRVPPTRSDVLHGVDVVEDVAIAHGFNNLPTRLPATVCAGGRELPLNGVSDALRSECAMAGFVEVLTWALLSRAEIYGHMRLEDPVPVVATGKGAPAAAAAAPAAPVTPPDAAVSVGNPATAEFEVCRPSLLPCLLKTLGANKEAPLPVRLFEVGDVVLADASRDVGARNERRLAALHCGREAEFEVAHGLLNRVMEGAGVPVDSAAGVVGGETDIAAEARLPFGGGGYWWKPCDHPSFLPGRHAAVMLGRGDKAREVGRFGVVHPDVLSAFGVSNAACAMELNLEPLVFDQGGKPLM
jgi:phenylalanyl-tRNA synthetase beta chain